MKKMFGWAQVPHGLAKKISKLLLPPALEYICTRHNIWLRQLIWAGGSRILHSYPLKQNHRTLRGEDLGWAPSFFIKLYLDNDDGFCEFAGV
jgi:hypothetical protein